MCPNCGGSKSLPVNCAHVFHSLSANQWGPEDPDDKEQFYCVKHATLVLLQDIGAFDKDRIL